MSSPSFVGRSDRPPAQPFTPTCPKRLVAMSNTLRELLASQDELVREAALALPHSFSQCTYDMGYVRQAIYLCLTCATPRGICYPCSVACHTDHEQVELFPKRHFRCDCPTGALSHPCGLHKRPEGVNTENEYGQNFEGKFCRCGRTYNAHTEVETMIQCLACEVCPSLLVCWWVSSWPRILGLVPRIVP